MSRELILKMSISVDGFVAGPNREMDWMFRSMSDDGRQWVLDLLSNAGLHAMGHRTYHDMANYWPTSDNPIAPAMNGIPKAVFSRSGTISAPSLAKTAAEGAAEGAAVMESWLHPSVVGGKELVADIQRLKAEGGKPILAHGGAAFASSLVAAHLVDVFHLVVHPVVLGRGLPIFDDLESPLHLKLEALSQTSTGVVIKTYRPIP